MSHTNSPIPSRNLSTNGSLPNHPPPPAAPTTVSKFLGIPTTTSVYFACTLFTLVEFAAFITVRSGAVAFFDAPNPLAVLLFACLFFLLLWDQRRCVRDLIVRCYPDCESGSASATIAAPAAVTTNAVIASAVMGPEGEELLGVFDKFQTTVYPILACIMVIFGFWVGSPATAIVASAVVSLLDFLLFLEFCREVPLKLGATMARNGGQGGGLQRGEGHHHHRHEQAVEGSAVPQPSESREDFASGGAETRERDLRRRLSCIPEEEEDGPSGQAGDDHPPADLVLSQQAQDLVWNRVRILAAREKLRERRRKKLLVRRAMRGVQGGRTQSWNAREGGAFSAMPPDSAQRSREEVSEEEDRQRQSDGGSRRVWERRGAISEESKDGRGTSGASSSGQPSSTTMPTMGPNPSTSVPQQQQTFPATEDLSHVPATMDPTDLQKQQQQQQARHTEAINHLARTKDSEIAALRAQMEGISKHFRAREEAYCAAHAAEVANAWRNAQVMFEKVGKLEGRLAAGSNAREEVGVEREEEWVRGASTEQEEERMGRELGFFAQEEKGEERVQREEDSISWRQQQQQQQQENEAVEEEEKKSTKLDLKLNLLLCQNTGCFCHFPIAPQHPQQQQQRAEARSTDEDGGDAIISQDNVNGTNEDEADDDGTNDDDRDAFTIILESSPPSLSSSSSSSASSRGDGRSGTLTPAEGSEISLSEWEMDSSAFESEPEYLKSQKEN